jgi:hypothetical protein
LNFNSDPIYIYENVSFIKRFYVNIPEDISLEDGFIAYISRNGTDKQSTTTRKKNMDSCVLPIELHNEITVETA